MYIFYSFLLGLGMLLSAPFLFARKKHRAGLAERLGRVPDRLKGNPGTPNIWIHAVSVGEVMAVGPLVTELRRRLPAGRVFVSTTTATGQALARQRFGEKNVFYFPFDFAGCIRPYLRSLKPALIATAETEFWPNFIRLAKQSGARFAVVNARISDRSLPGYRRWRLLMQPVLAAVDAFLAQTVDDAKRLIEIGAETEKVQVSGNLKFDVGVPADPPIIELLRAAFRRGGASSVLVCGSTVVSPVGGLCEEEFLLKAFVRVLEAEPASVLLLAPRKPERFQQVAAMVESLSLRLWRRSQLTPSAMIAGGVLLLDSIGELASLYRLGTLAFVGGSLVPSGGHNILEPAQAGVPVVVGPYTENFRDIVEIFARADAVITVQPNPEELAGVFVDLLHDSNLRTQLGERARQVFQSQAGATARTASALLHLIEGRQKSAERHQGEAAAP